MSYDVNQLKECTVLSNLWYREMTAIFVNPFDSYKSILQNTDPRSLVKVIDYGHELKRPRVYVLPKSSSQKLRYFLFHGP